MAMYLVKVVYQEGEHKGKTFYLGKGLRIVRYGEHHVFDWQCYETKKAAQMVATKEAKSNRKSIEVAKRQNERRAAQGLNANWYVNPVMSFEVIPVEIGG